MLTCPSCGQQNVEGARFCSACAAPFAAEAPERREERKVVTVLFADLVDFTARAERLDPEDVRALLAPYHARLRSELERFGGTVEKFIGDAVMALFGAPVTHEDDSERAVRAALSIRDWARGEGEVQLRIAVTTGEALVALGARTGEGEGMASGDVVNTASRLQAAAPANGVLVGETTYRGTKHAVDYRAHAPVEAKGKGEPVAVWEAVAVKVARGAELGRSHIIPLVGRERELVALRNALDRARAERTAQLVTIIGVPGIGKSRLAYELAQLAEGGPDAITWRYGRSLAYGDGITFWALAEIVKHQAEILESDPPETAEEKLHRTVEQVLGEDADAPWVERHLRPLVGLAGTPELAERLREAFAAWRRFLEGVAEREPLVLVFEDLQWADDGLLDFVDELVDRATTVPLLVVGTARPEFVDRRPNWGGGKPSALTISLTPLSDEETAGVLGAVLGRSLVTAEMQAGLLARARGNPLYAEQYARMLIEQGDLGTLPVPATIHGLLAARLDAVSTEEKRLLQDAAVVGEIFWIGALAVLTDLERWRVEEILLALERKHFVERKRRSAFAGEAEYIFRHVLIRDVAYGEIPRAARAERHRRTAEWIESLGRSEDHAELLAHHYLQALEYARVAGVADASLLGRARVALRDAANRAAALAAYGTMARFAAAAADLWPSDDPERAQLLLRCGRGRALAEGEGVEELTQALEEFRHRGEREHAAEAAVSLAELTWYRGEQNRSETYLAEAVALVEDLGDRPARAEVLVAQADFAKRTAQWVEALALAQVALPLVERLELDPLRSRVLYVLGFARVMSGDEGGLRDLQESVEVGRRCKAYYWLLGAYGHLASAQEFLGRLREARATLEERRPVVESFGEDLDWRDLWAGEAFQLYVAGTWDDSLRLLDRMIREVEASGIAFDESAYRWVRASIALARNDLAGASADSERLLELAREAKSPYVLGAGLSMRPSVLVAEGRREEAGALVSELLALGPALPMLVYMLVDIAWLADDLDRSAELIAALEGAPKTPWVNAARAVASGDPVAAAAILAEIEFAPGEAYARLRAAESLARVGRQADAEAELTQALGFYRSVGATRLIREGEALLDASGASRRTR